MQPIDKALVWTNIPNHYQGPFFAGLRAAGVDLRVNYYGHVREDRLRMGWAAFETLPRDECYVSRKIVPETLGNDWKERIHVVPGCGEPFLRALAVFLSRSAAQWVHWSEPARPGWRWYAGYPIKRWYARLVNRYALGAFGNGELALSEFRRWGVRAEKLALLTYSNPRPGPEAKADALCEEFRGARKAFCFVGALERRKGIDVLLQAFARLAKTSDEWVLLLVGPDRSSGRYAREIAALGLQDRVLLRGPVAWSAVTNVLCTAQVLVLPSRLDGWGVVLNEAASMALALIATDRCGAAYHLIEPGENGFRVRAGSVESLASAMGAYGGLTDLARRHGEHSLRLSRDYSAERNARRFITALDTWRAMEAAANASGN